MTQYRKSLTLSTIYERQAFQKSVQEAERKLNNEAHENGKQIETEDWQMSEIFSFCTTKRDLGEAMMSSTSSDSSPWKHSHFEIISGSLTFYRQTRFSKRSLCGTISLDGAAIITIDGLMKDRPNCFLILDRVAGNVHLLSVEHISTKRNWVSS